MCPNIKIANVFISSSASLKYEFQSLNALQNTFTMHESKLYINPDLTASKGEV